MTAPWRRNTRKIQYFEPNVRMRRSLISFLTPNSKPMPNLASLKNIRASFPDGFSRFWSFGKHVLHWKSRFFIGLEAGDMVSKSCENVQRHQLSRIFRIRSSHSGAIHKTVHLAIFSPRSVISLPNIQRFIFHWISWGVLILSFSRKVSHMRSGEMVGRAPPHTHIFGQDHPLFFRSRLPSLRWVSCINNIQHFTTPLCPPTPPFVFAEWSKYRAHSWDSPQCIVFDPLINSGVR